MELESDRCHWFSVPSQATGTALLRIYGEKKDDGEAPGHRRVNSLSLRLGRRSSWSWALLVESHGPAIHL
ncbi:hypothetical protein U9M48_040887 [Paspalum notatum var. saurae]|uniref:Uncharacterized protein n=1 Tax=Paspalum notatum var. saurae TaxID=547442 RepID=A0AAQ3XG06_PASNO